MQAPATALPDARFLEEIQDRAARLQQQAAVESFCDWGYLVWLALFALGIVLLLAWALWPRQRVLTGRGWRDEAAALDAEPHFLRLPRAAPGFAGGLLLLVLCAIGQQIAIDQRRGFIADLPRRLEAQLSRAEAVSPQERDNLLRSRYLYLPEGHSLRYLFLGNTALAADYLWLTSLQHVSSPFVHGQKFELLHRFYYTLMDVEPGWVEALTRAGRILSALDPNRAGTERFFQRAMTLNPEDPQLPLEAGQLFVIPPTDPARLKLYSDKAGYYFEKALGRPGLALEARDALRDLIGRLKLEAGYHEESASHFWRVATDRAAPDGIRHLSSRAWLQPESLVREDAWRKLVAGFKEDHGRPPRAWLEALQDAARRRRPGLPGWMAEGLGGAVPLDAYGYPFDYDPATGAVASRGVKAQRAIQTAAIIWPLSQAFTAENGRNAKDLGELTAWLKKYFQPPNDPPFTVLDALGQDLDCSRNPLGGPWDYDSRTGKLNLPPECAPAELFRNQNYAFEGRLPPYFGPPRP